jgi:hypothetical protein
MKKYLFVITISAASCGSTKEAVSIIDTIYIAQRQYDSVMIDRQTLMTTSHDTVYVDRFQTEYRYRLKTDTLHHFHTDTVVKIIAKQAPAEKSETHLWPMVGLVALAATIVVERRWKT